MKPSKILTLIVAIAPLVLAQMPIDSPLPSYKKNSGVSGNLNIIGSDTMNNLMTYWAEEFKKFYPNVNIQVEGKGSSTAPPALISHTAQLGPMSRLMKDAEIDLFEKTFGYKPLALRAAVDAIVVYVNKDNPLQSISLRQLDAVFSITRRGGHPQNITRWGQLGLAGYWTRRPISLYGRNSASGTYGYFKEHALFKGDLKNAVNEQPGSGAVVQGVSQDRGAIGYSGIGYLTSSVRALALKVREGGAPVEPTIQNALSGEYPLARFLYVYVNKQPSKPLDPLTREFLKFIFSKEGQQVIIKDGYMPLPATIVQEELERLK